MSRTYRRRGEYQEYRWVLRDWSAGSIFEPPVLFDRQSSEARRAISRFHSDAESTTKGGVPHWFCRIFKRRQRNANTRELLRWLADPGYDPMTQARHRHTAKWSWW